MKWNSDELLNHNRRRSSRVEKSEIDGRNDFENDYTRIIFCSAFRRLQDKTQVFPLEKNDFVRTRLTHSIEVSALASSIGSSIEKVLIEKKEIKDDDRGKIKAILSSAGLLHDIGNTPFGHFGEKAIQNYFRGFFENKKHVSSLLTEEEKLDFEFFDGNAHAFRIVTKLQYLEDLYGLNLTYATLATIIKYPRSSSEGNKKIDSKKASYKKFGYFQSDKHAFNDIVGNTGIKKPFGQVLRHPLVFLLEAADDIAYSIADIEDGIKKRILTIKEIYHILHNKLYYNDDGSIRNMSLDEKDIMSLFEEQIDDKYPNKDERMIIKLRIKIQSFMIKSVVEFFEKEYSQLMNGKFDDEILMKSKAGRIREAFQEISMIVFKDQNIIKNELTGEKVITRLLDLFVGALTNTDNNGGFLYEKNGTRENKLYTLISNNYRFIFEHHTSKGVYDKLLLATDFICGMTDFYALDLYQKLNGVV